MDGEAHAGVADGSGVLSRMLPPTHHGPQKRKNLACLCAQDVNVSAGHAVVKCSEGASPSAHPRTQRHQIVCPCAL